MYLHIGGDVVVSMRDIIGIFDFERTTTSQITRGFITIAEEEGFVMTIGDDLPKSYVISVENNRYVVYVSPISPATLKKRFERMLSGRRRN